MKEIIELPKSPSLSDSHEFLMIREIVQASARMPLPAFTSIWTTLCCEYYEWENRIGQYTSGLLQKLKFYELLLSYFPMANLKTNKPLSDVVLSYSPKVGEKVKTPTGIYEITDREITDHLSVLFSLKDSDGNLTTHDFFD